VLGLRACTYYNQFTMKNYLIHKFVLCGVLLFSFNFYATGQSDAEVRKTLASFYPNKDIPKKPNAELRNLAEEMASSAAKTAERESAAQQPTGATRPSRGTRKEMSDTYRTAQNTDKGRAKYTSARSTVARIYEKEFGKAVSRQNNRRKEKSCSWGDPHIITLDGLKYDFQTVGEFTLLEIPQSEFAIQTRQKPMGASVSVNTAVAMNVDGDRVAIYVEDFPDDNAQTPLWINGKPTKQQQEIVLPKGGKIYINGNVHLIRFNFKGDVTVTTSKKYLNVCVDLKELPFRGLLGDGDGNPDNDLQPKSGLPIRTVNTFLEATKLVNFGSLQRFANVGEKAYLKKISKNFGDSWRITQSESLFDYKPGLSTEFYQKRDFPRTHNTLKDLSPEQFAKSRQTCLEAGVSDDDLGSCIYDVAFSEQDQFAASMAQLDKVSNLLNDLGLGNPLKGLQLENKQGIEDLKSIFKGIKIGTPRKGKPKRTTNTNKGRGRK